MTLINLIDTLKNIAKLQPNIRTATDGSIYEVLNANSGVEYGVFHITQTSHVNSNGFDTYGLNLFIVDRLMDDESNRILIQSKAKDGLTNIINTFCEDYMAEHEDIIFQPFTDRFKDYCAGVYCSVRIQIAEDSSCTLDYENNEYKPNIMILNNQNITITENGTYYPDEGFTGFGKVNVDIPIEGYMYRRYNENGVYMIEPNTGYAGLNTLEIDVDVPIEGVREINVDEPRNNYIINVRHNDYSKGLEGVDINVNVPIEGEKFVDINGNGNYDIEVFEGHIGQGDVHINVDIPIEGEKFVDINGNGNYDIEVAEGFAGQGDVHLNVNVPVPAIQDEKNVILNAGATGEILPDEGFNAIAKVSYSVNKTEKMVIPNGITFSGSTFTEFDGSKYDWSMVYDCYDMFYDCQYLTTITGIDNLKVLGSMERMFRQSVNLTSIDLSTWDVSNVIDMNQMFYGCTNLTSVKFGGSINPNVKTTLMFSYIFKSGTLYYPEGYDYTPIINALPDTWTAVAY